MTKAELNELVSLRVAAQNASAEYRDALEAIADKTGENRSAIRRYVTAIATDKLAKLRAEVSGLEQLDLDFGVERAEMASRVKRSEATH